MALQQASASVLLGFTGPPPVPELFRQRRRRAPATLGRASLEESAVAALAGRPVAPLPQLLAAAEKDDSGRLLLKSLTFAELRLLIGAVGEKPGRAADVSRWMYAQGRLVSSLDEASRGDERGRDTLGGVLRAAVAAVATVDGGLTLESVTMARDGTRKLISRLTAGPGAGKTVETVLIPMVQGPQKLPRYTVCVSSQVGCAMNCQFCYTGRLGLMANLLTVQIVEQVVVAKRLLQNVGDFTPVTGVVFMGMGEPFDNYDAVMRAVKIMSDVEGLRIAGDRITVSTVGIVPQIESFYSDPSNRAGLAVSIHATTDEVRDWIVPVNRRHGLGELAAVLERHAPRPQQRSSANSVTQPGSPLKLSYGAEPDLAGGEEEEDNREELLLRQNAKRKRRRVVQIEYTLLAGVNDSDEDAERLARLFEGVDCVFNLIRFNAHDAAIGFAAAPPERLKAFREILVAAGRLCTLRESKGDDEMSACGQLGAMANVEAAGRRPVALSERPAALKN